MRLKTAIGEKAMADRLSRNPEIVELHLIEEDLFETKRVEEAVLAIQKAGAKAYLHHPMTHKGVHLDILSEDEEMRKHYAFSCETLGAICERLGIFCVVHAHYSKTESSKRVDLARTLEMKAEIEKMSKLGKGRFLWEDTVEGLFSMKNPHLLEHLVKPLDLPLCKDISHSFIALEGDNDALERSVRAFAPHVRYYHVVDSMGKKHDSLPIGEGAVQWARIAAHLKDEDFIFEIGLTDFDDCSPMAESAKRFEDVLAEMEANKR